MRLAMITETFVPDVNGVSLTLNHWCRGLISKGAQIDLVWPGVSDSSLPKFSSWQAAGHPLPGYRSLKFGWKLPERVKKHWRDNPPDIFYIATEGPLGLDALRFARRRKIPVITGFHTNFDQYLTHYRLGWLKTPLQAYLKAFHRASNLTLTPSFQQRNELLDQGYGRVERLGRGVDTELFHPSKRCAELRQSLGLAENQLLVGYVGRLAGEKNLPLLLRAFKAVRSEQPLARLLLVGDGPLEQEVRSQCPSAILVGCKQGEDLARHYASMDLFLFPSLTETYGNVVAEALASGLPVVGFQRAAAGELITQGRQGYLVEEASGTAAFVQAACDLALDETLRLQMGQLAYQRMQHHSWDEVVERFYQLLTAHLQGELRHELETPAARLRQPLDHEV